MIDSIMSAACDTCYHPFTVGPIRGRTTLYFKTAGLTDEQPLHKHARYQSDQRLPNGLSKTATLDAR